MGISGHILGDKKLRRLNRETGFMFDRAYRRGTYGEGREIVEGVCKHYSINWHEKTIVGMSEEETRHWASCPR